MYAYARSRVEQSLLPSSAEKPAALAPGSCLVRVVACLHQYVSSRAPEGASVHGGAVVLLKSVERPHKEAHSCPHLRARRSSGGPSGFRKADPQPGVVRDWKSKDR